MALIVEDGTGLAVADSLCSLEQATAYHAGLGNAAWANLASDTEREVMLRRATAYMEAIYRTLWAGNRLIVTQALSWPRTLVPVKDYAGAYYASDEVPVIVANACAELALRAISGDLAPDVGRLKKRVKVGEIETEYADSATGYTRYRLVDKMLEPFMGGSSGMNIRLVRA